MKILRHTLTAGLLIPAVCNAQVRIQYASTTGDNAFSFRDAACISTSGVVSYEDSCNSTASAPRNTLVITPTVTSFSNSSTTTFRYDIRFTNAQSGYWRILSENPSRESLGRVAFDAEPGDPRDIFLTISRPGFGKSKFDPPGARDTNFAFENWQSPDPNGPGLQEGLSPGNHNITVTACVKGNIGHLGTSAVLEGGNVSISFLVARRIIGNITNSNIGPAVDLSPIRQILVESIADVFGTPQILSLDSPIQRIDAESGIEADICVKNSSIARVTIENGSFTGSIEADKSIQLIDISSEPGKSGDFIGSIRSLGVADPDNPTEITDGKIPQIFIGGAVYDKDSSGNIIPATIQANLRVNDLQTREPALIASSYPSLFANIIAGQMGKRLDVHGDFDGSLTLIDGFQRAVQDSTITGFDSFDVAGEMRADLFIGETRTDDSADPGIWFPMIFNSSGLKPVWDSLVSVYVGTPDEKSFTRQEYREEISSQDIGGGYIAAIPYSIWNGDSDPRGGSVNPPLTAPPVIRFEGPIDMAAGTKFSSGGGLPGERPMLVSRTRVDRAGNAFGPVEDLTLQVGFLKLSGTRQYQINNLDGIVEPRVRYQFDVNDGRILMNAPGMASPGTPIDSSSGPEHYYDIGPACFSDMNGDNQVDYLDTVEYIDLFDAGSTEAEFAAPAGFTTASLDVTDIAEFLSAAEADASPLACGPDPLEALSAASAPSGDPLTPPPYGQVLPCDAIDVAAPFGLITYEDMNEWLSLYVNGDTLADIVAPYGVVDTADLAAFDATSMSCGL